MSIQDLKETETEFAHRWQNFRIRCIELALQSGAVGESVIGMAEKLGAYILTKSELEKKAAASIVADDGDHSTNDA